jgi:hypothetical protein
MGVGMLLVKGGCYVTGSCFCIYFLKYSTTPALITSFLSLNVLSFCSKSMTLTSSAFGFVYKVCLIFLTNYELIFKEEGCC